MQLAPCAGTCHLGCQHLTQSRPGPLPPAPQRALLRTAQEIAKGMGYIHEFNIGGFCMVAAAAGWLACGKRCGWLAVTPRGTRLTHRHRRRPQCTAT